MAQLQAMEVGTEPRQAHCDLFQQAQLRRNSSTATAGSKSSASQIVDFYANRSVLITGGSGFVGKVLIEKLLRSCPRIKHVFVLIRPKWDKQPSDRLKELLEAPLFDGVRCQQLMDKVIVVDGDVTQANLGMSNENLLRIMNEVSVIYHSAATVKFDEPLKQSIGINIAGTKHMIELCRKIPQLAALVHVSTAYANCDLEEIDEHVYPCAMDPENMVEMANWLDQDTLQELKFRLLKSKPNTYTYTKALAEWLLIKCARDLPVVVCRPSIVVASWREPFAGWIDNVNGPTGVILGAGKGLVRTMYADPKCVADLVPVDTVINMVIALGWFAHIYHHHKQPNDSSAESLTESLIGSSSSERSFDGLTSGLLEQSNNNNNNNQDDHHHEDHDNNMTTFPHDLNSLTPASETFDSIMTTTTTTTANNNDNNLAPMYHSDEGYLSTTHSPNATRSSNSPLVSLSSLPDKNLNLDTVNDIHVTSNFNMNNNNNNNNNNSSSNNNNNTSKSDRNKTIMDQNQMMLSLVSERKMADERHAAFEYKLKQFRHNIHMKLSARNLPEDIADVPVFHCTSGSTNPITWATLQIIILSVLAQFPSKSTYRYPNGGFTRSKLLDDFYRITLHYIPAYIVDFITQLSGGKPMLVRLFRKFDQAAKVLSSFTLYQWSFKTDNSSMLIRELMSDEDRRLFNFDLAEMSWKDFLGNYALGVRRYLLKEPMETLEESRQKLKWVYVRNLSLQILFYAVTMYYLSSYLIAPLVY